MVCPPSVKRAWNTERVGMDSGNVSTSAVWYGIETRRTDWPQVCLDLYTRVVRPALFGVCMVSKERALMGQTLRCRSNPRYPDAFMGRWIRSQFHLDQFDRVFWRSEDLILDPVRPVCTVASSQFGIPKGCHVVRVAGRRPTREAALVVFGPEASKSQLDDQLSSIQIVALRYAPRDDANRAQADPAVNKS
jgi:hypothetical protein